MEVEGVLKEFGKDDVYKLFLVENFDVKVVTSSAVQLVAVSEHLAKLFAGISLLDKELHKQVSRYYEGLLFHATEIEILENVLSAVHSRIQFLLLSSDRLLRNVSEPYESVAGQTVMLVRIQKTCDLLRRVIRVMHLCCRLEAQLNMGINEIVKASQSLNELDYLTDGVDLRGIHIVEKDLQLIKGAKEKISGQALMLLSNGIENQDRTNIRTALQVFNNLQVLSIVIDNLLERTKDKINHKVRQALDVRLLSSQSQDASQKIYVPGRATMPLAGNNAAFRISLWANMEDLMSYISSSCQQIQNLQNVLVKKKVPLNQVKYADELQTFHEPYIVQRLWETITKTLTDEFSHAADESTYIKQAFEVEFPRLLCLFSKFLNHLYNCGCNFIDVDADAEGSTFSTILNEQWENRMIMNRKPEMALRNALIPFESAYLSRCLSRLTDLVNVVYAGDEQNLPTAEDIEGIVKAIKSELTAASVDSPLLVKVSELVLQTIRIFVEKCQYLVSTDQTATQVIDVPNSSQLVNARVVNLLHLLQRRVKSVLKNISVDEAVAVIESSLQSVDTLISIVVEPLMQSVSNAVEAIITTMHREDYSMQLSDDTAKAPEASCSLFMKELQKFVARVQNDYFSLYPECDALLNGMQMLGHRAVELFVKHASLVRPLGEGGKRKLASDCAQMEMVVSQLCQRLGDLGRVYRLLRSFRPLLFQTSYHIAQSLAIGDIISYSLAIHVLFSRGPPELKSPHLVARMSLEEYSQWLDNHNSEKERLVLIKASVEKYENWVRQRRDKEFCSVYPVIVDLLERGLKAN